MGEKRLPSRAATEAYVSEAGFVCLKQEENGEESMVFLHPDDIPTIVSWLEELVPEAREAEAENQARIEEKRSHR